MNTLEIAFVRQKYNPYGGAERFVERALQALATNKVNMTVLSRRWDATNSDYQFLACHPFYLGRLWRDWGFAREVCQQLKTLNVEIVQSHERIPCIDIYRAGDGVHKVWLQQKARASGVLPALIDRFSPYHSYTLRAEKTMFESPRLQAVICNSVMVRDEIIEHFDITPEKLHVIYSGVDTTLFRPERRSEQRDALRRELNIAKHDPVLLMVGSGYFRKGLDAVLQAMSTLRAPPMLVVVGYDKHADRYLKLARSVGLQERVVFAGAQLDVLPYYAMADAFVLPSLYDPFPNAALEAMACGLPVVTSNKTGAAEFIDNGVQGYVVDAFDYAQLAGAIVDVSDQERAAQMGIKAREKLESFGLDVMADKLVDLYHKVVEDKHR